MEFNQKLQELRKQKNLTQEELAEMLFVSRAAVSKWESGRGWPSIDSLKSISALFSVSIDDLLSSDQLLTIAENDSNEKQRHLLELVYCILDISSALFCFMPLFGQKNGEIINMVPLFSLTDVSPLIKSIYFTAVICMIVNGIVSVLFKYRNKNVVSIISLTLFMLWTVAVCFIDVRAVGPENSAVGFSTLNIFFHNITGVNMWLHSVTDWLSIIPICIVAGFGLLGLSQLIKRKNLFRADYDILMLGIFYIAVFSFFIFFEVFPVNYRPVLINGILETSYPSSTTMLVLCVMPTAYIQLNQRINNTKLKRYISIFIRIFTVFMVAGRILSGVHWITDIIGGVFISYSLVNIYRFFTETKTDL